MRRSNQRRIAGLQAEREVLQEGARNGKQERQGEPALAPNRLRHAGARQDGFLRKVLA